MAEQQQAPPPGPRLGVSLSSLIGKPRASLTTTPATAPVSKPTAPVAALVPAPPKPAPSASKPVPTALPVPSAPKPSISSLVNKGTAAAAAKAPAEVKSVAAKSHAVPAPAPPKPQAPVVAAQKREQQHEESSPDDDDSDSDEQSDSTPAKGSVSNGSAKKTLPKRKPASTPAASSASKKPAAAAVAPTPVAASAPMEVDTNGTAPTAEEAAKAASTGAPRRFTLTPDQTLVRWFSERSVPTEVGIAELLALEKIRFKESPWMNLAARGLTCVHRISQTEEAKLRRQYIMKRAEADNSKRKNASSDDDYIFDRYLQFVYPTQDVEYWYHPSFHYLVVACDYMVTEALDANPGMKEDPQAAQNVRFVLGAKYLRSLFSAPTQAMMAKKNDQRQWTNTQFTEATLSQDPKSTAPRFAPDQLLYETTKTTPAQTSAKRSAVEEEEAAVEDAAMAEAESRAPPPPAAATTAAASATVASPAKRARPSAAPAVVHAPAAPVAVVAPSDVSVSSMLKHLAEASIQMSGAYREAATAISMHNLDYSSNDMLYRQLLAEVRTMRETQNVILERLPPAKQ